AALRPHLEGAEVVFAPSAVSTHSTNLVRRHRRRKGSDHLRVRQATLAVSPNAWLYSDLPYSLSPDRGFVLPTDVRRPRRSEHRRGLDADPAAAKIESFRCYSTQVDRLVEIFGDFVDAAGLGLEVVWEPPTSDGAGRAP